jgi:Type IV secretion-system coupling protein DNA-binding domain
MDQHRLVQVASSAAVTAANSVSSGQLDSLLLITGLGVIGVAALARLLDGRSWAASLQAFSLRLPTGLTPIDVANWLASVAAATHAPRLSLLPQPPVALEIVATTDGITHILLVPERLQATVLSGLRAALPGMRIEERPDYLKHRPTMTVAAEAVLTSHRRPLATDRAAATATALLATLQPLHPGQQIVIQWIFTGAGTPKPISSTPVSKRGDLTAWLQTELTDGEAIRAARLKQTDALLHASLRVGVTAGSHAAALGIFGRVWGQHRGLNAAGVLVVRRWWLPAAWAASRLQRFVVPITGWPFLVGSQEAAGLLALPVGDTALPGVPLALARQLPPPPCLPSTGVQLGVSNYPGSAQPLRLLPDDRLRHLHVVGPTGTGKSTLLVNMVAQDIAAGHGVIVIDVLGDLTNNILARLPDNRADDVIVLDPSVTDRPIGFNILQAAHDEQSRELVVDSVIHIWHELYKDFWGPRTEDVLRGALLTLINTHAADGSAFTLVEVPELLTNASLRQFVLRQPGVPAGLESFWGWYQAIKPADRLKIIGPILNKLRAATLRTPIRLMLGQPDGLDLPGILAKRRVLLVPLRKGTLGGETAGLLGTLLLAAIWQAVLGRVTHSPSERRPVFVYVDEAQDVLKLPVDMADMLAQSRGLGVGYTLAHQYLGQVEKKAVKDALLGTVRSQIVFQCGRSDAVDLAKSFEPRLTADDLMGLAQFEVAVRPCVHGQTLAPVTGTTLPMSAPSQDAQGIAVASRQRHGQPRSDVEAAIKVRSTSPVAGKTADTNADASTTRRFGRRRAPGSDDGGAS